jgi:hypothetical protein
MEIETEKNNISIVDGYLLEGTLEVDRPDNENLDISKLKGLFNAFIINRSHNTIDFYNDKEGRIPVYFFSKNKQFAFSNNVWLLVQITYNKINIDYRSVVAQTLFFTDPIPQRTLFNNICKITPGSNFKLDALGNIFQKNEPDLFSYSPNNKLTQKDIFDKIDGALDCFFRNIKKSNEGKILGFGNSGGFDSRLIAFYSNKFDIPNLGYAICQKRPHLLLKSTTALLSKKVADLYELPNKIIEPNNDTIMNRMLLDIRNNPFASQQFFKNLYDQVPFFDYEVAGQPGALAYIFSPDLYYNNSVDRLFYYCVDFLNNTKSAQSSLGYFRYRAKKYLHINTPMRAENSIFQSIKDISIESYYGEIRDVLNQLRGNNNVETYIRFHDFVTNKYVYCGGYESFNRTKKTYYLYSNYFYDVIKEIPFKYFIDREILKIMFKYLDPRLNDIPGQNLQNAKTNKHSLCKKLEMGIRGRGMNIFYLLKDKKYIAVQNKILSKKNDLFDDIFDKKKLNQSNILKKYNGPEILKIKLMLDIFVNQRFDLFNDEDFKIIS